MVGVRYEAGGERLVLGCVELTGRTSTDGWHSGHMEAGGQGPDGG